MLLLLQADGPEAELAGGGVASTSYWKQVERPYPGVPRAGDIVALDDCNGCEVQHVEWEEDGTVVLGFGGGWDVPELEEFGFSDIRPTLTARLVV